MEIFWITGLLLHRIRLRKLLMVDSIFVGSLPKFFRAGIGGCEVFYGNDCVGGSRKFFHRIFYNQSWVFEVIGFNQSRIFEIFTVRLLSQAKMSTQSWNMPGNRHQETCYLGKKEPNLPRGIFTEKKNKSTNSCFF